MSLEAMREAEAAVPVCKGSLHQDRLVIASDPEGEPYQTLTVHYDTCLAGYQLDRVRDTEGLQLTRIHPADGDGVRAHFRYYPEGGEQ